MDKPKMEFKITTQEIIDDLHYHQAQAIAEDFLARGLINQSQFEEIESDKKETLEKKEFYEYQLEEIEKLNRQFFPPLLAELMV